MPQQNTSRPTCMSYPLKNRLEQCCMRVSASRHASSSKSRYTASLGKIFLHFPEIDLANVHQGPSQGCVTYTICWISSWRTSMQQEGCASLQGSLAQSSGRRDKTSSPTPTWQLLPSINNYTQDNSPPWANSKRSSHERFNTNTDFGLLLVN